MSSFGIKISGQWKCPDCCSRNVKVTEKPMTLRFIVLCLDCGCVNVLRLSAFKKTKGDIDAACSRKFALRVDDPFDEKKF